VVNSLGAEWTQRSDPGQHAPLRDRALPALSSAQHLRSAYGIVQRSPEFIFDGENRVAEYDVLTRPPAPTSA
jgi:hypothetical protein